VSVCRSCGQPMEMGVTVRAGADMPLDLGTFDNGNIAIVGRTHDGKPLALVLQRADLDRARERGVLDLRRSHFASCPDAEKWRQRPTKRGAT
jgi:hypothetical protein